MTRRRFTRRAHRRSRSGSAILRRCMFVSARRAPCASPGLQMSADGLYVRAATRIAGSASLGPTPRHAASGMRGGAQTAHPARTPHDGDVNAQVAPDASIRCRSGVHARPAARARPGDEPAPRTRGVDRGTRDRMGDPVGRVVGRSVAGPRRLSSAARRDHNIRSCPLPHPPDPCRSSMMPPASSGSHATSCRRCRTRF